MNLKYTDILRQNAAYAERLGEQRYRVAILSNVVVSQAKDLVEHALRSHDVPAVVTFGDYDNIVQDSLKHRDADLVILFWEAWNLVDGLQHRIDLMEAEAVDALAGKVTAEIDFVLDSLKDTPLVLVNSFSALHFAGLAAGPTALEALCARLNRHLSERAPRHVKVVDLDRVLAHVGVPASVDWRYLHSSKAPYTIDFFRAYAQAIKPYVLSARGKAKKALIFDCDNTLWKGVLGEDGFDGVEMSPSTKAGAAYAEVQALALALARQGVLLGLCSKNNPADVDQVLRSHPDMQLREEHIAVKRVNWQDKVTNLKEIASELNIGLDSLVMVDDSPFEAGLIREQLPQVTVLQVPEAIHLYPGVMRAGRDLFYSLSSTAEDRRKGAMYAEQAQREAQKAAYADLDGYLASLGTSLTIHHDDASIIPRMAQLTQKTNQFNLTTRRYTEADIARLVDDARTAVFALGVKDKFGDSGITGLCIVRTDGGTATIDTLLMSCRVLGRKIEFAFVNWLVDWLKAAGIAQVEGTYLATAKNAQVMDFFDRCSFPLRLGSDTRRDYSLDVNDYRAAAVHPMEIVYGRANQERDGGRVQHAA